MSRYVLAVKPAKRAQGVTTRILDEFPGLVRVGDDDPYIVAVEADPAALKAFRKRYGSDFLIETTVARSVPDQPLPIRPRAQGLVSH